MVLEIVCKQNSIEFVSICNGINDMLETIEKRNRENIHVHDQLYQAELARVEAQLYALRNQINPHFLYNTLQTVRGMAVYYGIPEIACIVTNMAYIFRYAVREESVAPIKEEMMVARKFIEIMNIRQDGKYHYSESMEPGLENSLVLRMIIQPVIENSVQHAFKNVEDKAEIILQCYCNENNVYIMIKDNGCGMSEYAVSDLVRKMQKPFSLVDARESDSLGLHNIHQRLRLRYGEGYGVTVQSKIGVGTSVILKMPIDHP